MAAKGRPQRHRAVSPHADKTDIWDKMALNLQAIEKRLDRIEQALMKILLVLDQLEGDDPPDSQVSTLDGHQIDLPDGTSSLD